MSKIVCLNTHLLDLISNLVFFSVIGYTKLLSMEHPLTDPQGFFYCQDAITLPVIIQFDDVLMLDSVKAWLSMGQLPHGTSINKWMTTRGSPMTLETSITLENFVKMNRTQVWE